MLKGALESTGIKVSESRVAASLQRVAPIQYEQRRHDAMDNSTLLPILPCTLGISFI